MRILTSGNARTGLCSRERGTPLRKAILHQEIFVLFSEIAWFDLCQEQLAIRTQAFQQPIQQDDPHSLMLFRLFVGPVLFINREKSEGEIVLELDGVNDLLDAPPNGESLCRLAQMGVRLFPSVDGVALEGVDYVSVNLSAGFPPLKVIPLTTSATTVPSSCSMG